MATAAHNAPPVRASRRPATAGAEGFTPSRAKTSVLVPQDRGINRQGIPLTEMPSGHPEVFPNLGEKVSADPSPRRSSVAAGQARRRSLNLPRELAYLAPILRERGRIEALAAALIDLLDSFDAPTADLEEEQDCCSAADDDLDSLRLRQRHDDCGAGDRDDAEPDDEDCCLACDDRGSRIGGPAWGRP
ncbi:hypothetical protein [Roseomonas sp. 18066]|uniref:hypothetical protein n=1 Tax=Roseomonas sp. 18066 TaxID=2681412 RepID=UPI00135BF26E|nr:hypothetical protein [Roseomonas sp. 18066]